MKKFFIGLLSAIIVSSYYFPFEFTFLPAGINTKMILAALGVVWFILKGIRDRATNISKRTLVAGFLAVFFSLWCYFCIIINGTDDMTYVEYWISFGTWMAGAYAVYCILKGLHGKADLPLITKYLAIVAVAQCAIALMIDNIPLVEDAVKATIRDGYDFFERGGRLYGIGCALDPAGIRFCTILLLVSHQISANPEIKDNTKATMLYILALIIITIVGSMIARTTSIGTAMSLALIIVSYIQLRRGSYISGQKVRLSASFIALVTFAVVVSMYLYNSNTTFREDMRFGFEGFFNWVETGEFRTTSTDILHEVMWVWPYDMHGWLVGYGRYGLYVWNSDIGYCLFTLYCGLPGLVLFSIFFIYCHLSLNGKYKNFYLLSLFFVALTFIVWAKVATDIFLMDALLFCMDGDKTVDSQEDPGEVTEGEGIISGSMA